MSFVIALAGKGGVGKTTVAGMLVKYMKHKGMTPILAVDADPNANLNEVLGLPVDDTLGQAREDMKKGVVPQGMTKDTFIEMRMEQAVAEADGYDLIVMGQPEGSGCYCAANSLLARFLEKLSDNYAYIIMDNEAGMEHISRLTTKNVDVLLIVADTSRRAIQAAGRIDKLARELAIGVKKSYLILNMAKGDLTDQMRETVASEGLNLAGVIPDDAAVTDYDMAGKPTVKLPDESPSMAAAFKIFDAVFSGNGGKP
ncbi:MAG: AAA family ATPase [Thermodesulfobacteriota bacterium]